MAENEQPESEGAPESIVRTTRDDDALRVRLQAYLADQLPEGAAPEVSELSSPSGSGMSSETLLFDATWSDASGKRSTTSLVGRMAPSDEDVPTFPRYDMAVQAGVMRLAERAGVPVPPVRWLEADASVLGAPFFVMERIEGRVPPDVPPYLAAGWVFESTPADRRALQDATVRAIARIHSIDRDAEDTAFLEYDVPGATPLARHVADQRAYYDWISSEVRSPLIERAFDFLESNLATRDE